MTPSGDGERDIDFEGRYYRIEKGKLQTPFLADDGRTHPEIYIAGNSDAARRLALSRGTCWMRLGDTLQNVARSAETFLGRGVEFGLRFSVVAQPSRAEAVEAAHALVHGLGTGESERTVEGSFIARSDSPSMRDLYRRSNEEWLSPTVWTGAVKSHGPAAIALVGSAEEIAEALLDYGRAGVSQFILSGWPKVESLEFFGRHVLPLVRLAEAEAESAGEGAPNPSGR